MNVAARVYTAYGENAGSTGAARLAHSGEIVERLTGWYLLGGRPYDPVLRRFLVPDPESPFHEGGFNRYAYCSGDPVNRVDPSGNAWTDWLAGGFMVAMSVVGTVISAGALAAPLAAASATVASATFTAGAVGAVSTVIASAAATPGLVAATVAVTMDAISTMTAIGSLATMATHDRKANAILGWISMAAGVASGVATIVASKQLTSMSAKAFATRGMPTGSRGNWTPGPHATVSAMRAIMPASTSGASSRSSARESTGSLASGHLPQTRRTSTTLSSSSVSRTSLGTNDSFVTDGSRRTSLDPHGENRNVGRPLPGPNRKGAASEGPDAEPMDMTGATAQQIRRRLSDGGIHAAVIRHGSLDESVMSSLNMPSTVSGHPHPVRASP